ncbi:unnamed protein product [Lymnaea stagnalis]|uniref:Dysbindin n=1 Tax=Lymnaea stagnalis TaxID=6523 RepID=A0AAV2HAG2_LYMST
MSVFKKLKGTFQNVQQDIVDGLRTLTSTDSQPRHEQLRNLKSREINLDVGAELLFSYQQIWSEIQVDTKESAKKAEEVSIRLNPMFQVWDKCGESVSQLEEEVKTIPSILATLEQLQSLLVSLRHDFTRAEKGLDILENLCEEQELKKKCLEEQRKLTVYKLHKEAEADKIKVEMAQTHAKKMTKLELDKRVNLQERAEAFTSAFKEDLEFYRTHGHPDRITKEFPKVTSLSEIVIEEDKVALDSFLGPLDVDGTSELSGENAYIEDDYIGDFSIKEDSEFLEDVDYISSTVIADMEIGDDDYDDSPLTKSYESSKQDDNQKTDSNLVEKISRENMDNKIRTLTATSDPDELEIKTDGFENNNEILSGQVVSVTETVNTVSKDSGIDEGVS